MRLKVSAATLLLALIGLAPVASATTPTYAPIDRPGPPLSVPTATLAKALTCSGSFTANNLEPVLLSPGTGVTPEQNFSWNYERAFTAQKRPWCALTMPFHTLGDIQIAGEYLVYGIRTMHALAHRRIAILGHSQGGMSMRWALRFWPDTRPMVDDVIGLAGDNHGTTAGNSGPKLPGARPPAAWQQAAGSNFIKALNSGQETFPSISYTEIYTHTDEEVQPSNNDTTATSRLTPGPNVTNVAVQNICPADIDEHLLVGTIDPTAYALAMDALDHPGPANPARISRSVCRQIYQPGVNPLSASTYINALGALPGVFGAAIPGFNPFGAPMVTSEPPLACYTTYAGCR